MPAPRQPTEVMSNPQALLAHSEEARASPFVAKNIPQARLAKEGQTLLPAPVTPPQAPRPHVVFSHVLQSVDFQPREGGGRFLRNDGPLKLLQSFTTRVLQSEDFQPREGGGAVPEK